MIAVRPLACALVAAAAVGCGGDENAAPPTPEATAPLEGVVGRAPTAYQGVPSVVILSAVGSSAGEPPTEPAVMDQLGLAFTPARLMVRLGQTLRFVNSESLAHNVNVRSIEGGASVYIADMDPGDRTEIVLEAEGGYDVTCDVHPGMRALVYVSRSPYATFAEFDGTFSISPVPPGAYSAAAWTAQAGLGEGRTVEVSGAGTELDLTASQ